MNMGLSFIAGLTMLAALLLKSLLVIGLAGLALLWLRRGSSAARHLVCLLTLAALLALPALSLTLPGWKLPVTALLALPLSGELSGGARTPIPADKSATLPSEVRDRHGAQANMPGLGTPGSALLSLPSAPAPAPRSFPWPVALPLLWLLGVLAASARPLLGLWGIRHLSRLCEPVRDAPTLALAQKCVTFLRLKRTPVLRQADVPVPMTWGWRRPVVLLPLTAGEWPPDRCRAVLLHELAHVRRADWLWHRLADVACALYWFHPGVWLLAHRLRSEGELACDDLVLSSGIAAPEYARHLLAIARALPPLSIVPQAAIGMAQTSRIEGRLTMILDPTRSRRALTRRALLLILTPAVAVLVTLAMLRPTVRAQAAPRIAPLPPAVSLTTEPTPWNLKASTITASSDRQLTFSQDLSINGLPLLAGMTDGRLPGNVWWAADGTALPRPIYTPGSQDFLAEKTDQTARNLIFAFRLPPTAKDVTTKWEMPGSLHYSSEGTWLTKMVGHDDLPEAKISGDRGGVRTVRALYPRSLSHAAIRIGIASGPWTTAATQNVQNDWFGTTKTSPAGTFIFSRITQVDGGRPAVTITTDQRKQDIRVVAVDTQGHDILPSGGGDQSTDTLAQMTVEFALPSSATQLTQIRVETRPFQWIEIKDVALQPAK